ncbi:MAG: SLBB domain-containing protein [Burkholderiales bacterium]
MDSTSNDRQDRDGRQRRDGDADRSYLYRGRDFPFAIDPFEAYVRKMGAPGAPSVRRFGSELVTGTAQEVPDGNALVPPDYVLAPGDELQLALWGSVDANLRLPVDRTGRITIPRVGTVMVAGVRYADLPDVIAKRVAQVFRNFQISVSLGRLRSIRVYVTGYVKRPGAYTVSGLSTIVGALMRAGGPAASGSFRHIDLRRGKDVVTSFDLYDLLIKGDKTADRIIQADDVIHVGPVGAQVALVGSVNKPAIFELMPPDTYGDVLAMAGSFSAVADRSRIAVERLEDRQNQRITELALPESAKLLPRNGDVLRVFSVVDATLPVARQNKRIKVEGEVARPGEYVLPPASSIRDALQAAGGLTTTAYVFGTEFNRESVRRTQQENYDRALRDMETEFARNQSTQRALSADEAATFEARSVATQRLVTRLRAIKPTGRVVLQLKTEATELPDLALEDGDQLYVPAKPTTIGVFGSVFNAGSYLYRDGAPIDEFLRQAGGPTRGADAGSIFIIRANGSVVSNQQKTSFLGFGGGVTSLSAMAGDTVFVPEEMNKTTWVQSLKEWTQIFYQFGIGAAAVRTFTN